MSQAIATRAADAAGSATSAAPLLSVENLHVHFVTSRGVVRAVEGVNWRVNPGEMVALVGESGCGKSVSALSVMRLLARPAGRIVHGRILFEGRNLLELDDESMRQVRGRDISMIFQEPMTSLNPVLTIGRQIAETVRLHQGSSRAQALARAVEMLRVVQIPEPERRVHEYPHQLSGGMRQRVMIAMALACDPEVLIADEPTTALDVTIQAQILELIRGLQARFGMGVVMITHDLGVVAESCDRVVVMYAGRKVEEADVVELFERPLHPYTRALMASMPAMNTATARLAEIPGLVPAPSELGRGCAFAARCAHARERCRAESPALAGGDHVVACFAVEGRWELPAEARAAGSTDGVVPA